MVNITTIKKGQEFLENTLQLADELREAFNDSGIKEGEITGFRAALLGFMDQMQDYAEAVFILSQRNLTHVTIPIVRTIFETYITVKLLQEDKSLLERFVDFSWINKERDLRTLQKYGQWREQSNGDNDKISSAEIVSNAKKARDKHQFNGPFWFPPKSPGKKATLKDACELVGELQNYEMTYSHLSHIAHAGIMTFHSYDFIDDNKKKMFARMDRDDGASESSSADMLLITCNIFNNEFKLGKDRDIVSLQKKFR